MTRPLDYVISALSSLMVIDVRVAPMVIMEILGEAYLAFVSGLAQLHVCVHFIIFLFAACTYCSDNGTIPEKCEMRYGSCFCKDNVVGDNCTECIKGTYGAPDLGITCQVCPCENIDNPICHLSDDMETPICDNCGPAYQGDLCQLCSNDYYNDTESVSYTSINCTYRILQMLLSFNRRHASLVNVMVMLIRLKVECVILIMECVLIVYTTLLDPTVSNVQWGIMEMLLMKLVKVSNQ